MSALKRSLRVLTLLVAAAVIATLLLKRPVEPSYQGRGLSSWLSEFDDATTLNPRSEPSHAVQCIGVEALPTLLSTFRGRESRWNAVKWPLNHYLDTEFELSSSAEVRERAIRGFMVLGEVAAPAVLDLLSFLANPGEPDPYSVSRALAPIGAASGSAILRALIHPTNSLLRCNAAMALG